MTGTNALDNLLLNQFIGQFSWSPMTDGATILLWRVAGEGIQLSELLNREGGWLTGTGFIL